VADAGDGGFYLLVQLFRLLQAAGPDLTPQTLAKGARSLPLANGVEGAWSYNFGPDGQPGQLDHGATLDAHEEYWDANATSFDGQKGAFIFNAHRYRSGEWPSTPPDVYPT
jgi:hypothetical protein